MSNKKQKTSTKNILQFISEAGMLKRVSRSGWSVLGIADAESVAEHSFRCAVIGYLLAQREKADPYKVMLMALFGDIMEARITDVHKMAQRYFDFEKSENRAFEEQTSALPKPIREEINDMRKEYCLQRTKEGIVARDADILECLIQAKEYYENGHKQAAQFMKKAPGCLRSKSAKQLWVLARKTKLSNWWVGLSQFKR